MLQLKLLRKVLPVLEEHQIDYMITGSIVSSMQGAPRATHDVDVVVQINKNSIPILLNAFPPPQYYLSETRMRESIERKNSNSMFQLLEAAEGDKIDFWILTNEPFDKSRFSRKKEENFAGMKMKVSSPEDTIIKKLHWIKQYGKSEKQFLDALGVYEVQYGNLDLKYLEKWIEELGLKKLWNKLRKQAKPL